MVREWGGLAGIREQGAIESAVVRPQTGYYEDVIEEAAALCESLLQNHPFVDGNKRTAVTATAVFLRINGYDIMFDDREMYDWLMNLYATSRVSKIEIEAWLRSHAISV